MKKLLIILLTIAPTIACAHKIFVEGIYYDIDTENKTAIVVSSNGDENGYRYGNDITIPEAVEYEGNSYVVNGVGDYAFASCTNLQSVILPESILFIGECAFQGCTNLHSVNIPNGVKTIEKFTFNVCICLQDVKIPNSVEVIKNFAFQHCRGLASVDLGSGVMTIGKLVFDGCNSLLSVTIPQSVKSIDYAPFRSCNNITSITVEKGNENYDSRYDCNAIIETSTNTLILGCQNTVIPNDVVAIGGSAFDGCSDLTSIVIPQSVTEIGNAAFLGCSNLTSIEIPTSVKTIGGWVFQDCSSLSSISIPSSVTTIGVGAFSGCKDLTSIVIPAGVSTIEDYTFGKCLKLQSIVIPNSVNSIGYWAFLKLPSLKDFYCYAESVPSTDLNAFRETKLSEATLYVPSSAIENYKQAEPWSSFGTILPIETNVNKETVDGIEWTYMVVSEADKTCKVGASELKYSGSESEYYWENTQLAIDVNTTGTISIPSKLNDYTVVAIAEGAFIDCKISSVIIPEGVCLDEGRAFVSCDNLTSVQLPEGLTNTGLATFHSCRQLQTINLPSTLTRIEDETFENCASLKEIVLPANLISIGKEAFKNSAVTAISIPAEVEDINSSAFLLCNSLTSLSVAEDNSKYDSRNNCNAIIETATNKLVANLPSATTIPSFVKIIGAYLFQDSHITSIDIPEGVTTIEKKAFASSDLRTISFPSTLTSIGDEAFGRCKELTTVILPTSLTTIGDYAFESCKNLKDVYNLATVPQIINNDYSFSTGNMDGPIHGATLHVLPGCKVAYQAANVWKNFSNIVEDAVPASIKLNNNSVPCIKTRYTLDGRLSSSEKGITIIRLGNGSVKKIYF